MDLLGAIGAPAHVLRVGIGVGDPLRYAALTEDVTTLQTERRSRCLRVRLFCVCAWCGVCGGEREWCTLARRPPDQLGVRWRL